VSRLRPKGAGHWVLAALVVLGIGVWVFGGFWIGAAMFSEHNPKRADWRCERPANVYGTSEWKWWPPGRFCQYHDGSVSEPSETRSVVIVVLAVTGAIGVGAASAIALRSSHAKA
jgi:hypothetical protein